MKYTPTFFKETMPEWKRKKDSIVAQWIHRPISFCFSSLFAMLGMTPNQVSFLSLFIGMAAVICFLLNGKGWWLAGALLVNLWSITDSADGNMARSIGSQPYGNFIDALSSYFLVGFMFPALGMAVYRSGGLWFRAGDPWIIYLGSLASASDTMTRLFFQKMKSSTYELERAQGIVPVPDEEDAPEGMPVGRLAVLQSRIESARWKRRSANPFASRLTTPAGAFSAVSRSSSSGRITECGHEMAQRLHCRQRSASQRGTRRETPRFSYCVIPIGKEPSSHPSKALTGSSSPFCALDGITIFR